MSGWTEDRMGLLKAWRADGFTASEIANLFAERGFCVTRNAVLGKVHRLGLASGVPVGSRSPKAAAAEPKASKPPRVCAPRGAAPTVLLSAPTPGPVPAQAPMAPVRKPAPAPARAVAARPVLLWLIPPGGCHFPVAGEGAQTLFCADVARDGQPYCPHHHRITHQPVTGPARVFRDPSIVRTKRAEAQRDLVDEIGEAA